MYIPRTGKRVKSLSSPASSSKVNQRSHALTMTSFTIHFVSCLILCLLIINYDFPQGQELLQFIQLICNYSINLVVFKFLLIVFKFLLIALWDTCSFLEESWATFREKSCSELNVTLVDNKKESFSWRILTAAYSGWPGHSKCVSDHYFKLKDIPLSNHSSQESKVTKKKMSKEKPWTILSELLIQCQNAMNAINNLFLIILKVPKFVR